MKNVLLVMLEFDNWNQARAWSYTGAWAFQDGLEENGHRCTVLPAIWGRAPDAADSFIHHAEKLLAGQTFDEAWVWCVHTQFDARFWQWLARVAPKRIGITMESLGVNAAEAAEFPHFAQRQEEVLAQLAHCTHAIVADEADIDLVQQRLGIPASWNVVMVPERFVRFDAAPECPQAAFIGNKYGERRPYLEDPALAELLCRPHLPERGSDLPQRFDALHQEIRRLLLAGQFDHALLQRATLQMKLVREALFRLHLDGIRLGFANINLPSMIKAYAGRVTESMAAATPAVSWLPPDRPACARLFKAGTEIELFSSPTELHALLARQAPDSAQRNRQVTAARNTLLNRHTTRIRLRQYQNWLDQGIAPDFFSDIGYKPSVEESQYYKHFFAEDPHWSRPTPNGDERARWEKIQAMVARVREAQGEPLRIVEVGCGRGWLSKLLSEYGAVLGSEPVGDVINHAKGMFPEQEFFTGSAELLQFIGLKEFFDLLVCSEVIEHVPYAYKEGFVAGLTGLVRPGGYLILTTPRADIYPEWSEKYGKPPQPTEDWLTEAQLKALLEGAGCEALELQRAFLMDIYQIWLFRRRPKTRHHNPLQHTSKVEAGNQTLPIPTPDCSVLSISSQTWPTVDANNYPTHSCLDQVETLRTTRTRKCFITSPPFACGVARLINALLELNIRSTNPVFEPKHWQQEEDSHWHIGDRASGHLKWHLPVLHQRQHFDFPEDLEIIWEHRMDFARLGSHPTILFVRDPRDAIHSLYLRYYVDSIDFHSYLKRPDKWPDHFPELFDLPPFESFAYFCMFWKAMSQSMPLKVIRFEDLKHKPLEIMREILTFLGVERTEAEITRAIEASSFENAKQAMERMEQATGRVFKTTRKAQVGEWKTSYSPTELRCLSGPGQFTLEEFGYEAATSSRLREFDALIINDLSGSVRELAFSWLARTRSGERISANEIALTIETKQIRGWNLLRLATILVAIHYVCKLFIDTKSIQAHAALSEFTRLNLNFLSHAPIREAAQYGLDRISRLSGIPIRERIGRVWISRPTLSPEMSCHD